MSFLQSMRKPIAGLVIVALCVFSISWAPAQAAMVSTDEVLKQNKQNLDRERLTILLDRSEVQKQLKAWGVKSEEAKQWIDSLTDREIAEIVNRIDQMPAGGSFGTLVGAAVLVFLVLLITDILGYTDIFPFVKGK
jgi:formiminotetrahydrofolate cyclodeaminase